MLRNLGSDAFSFPVQGAPSCALPGMVAAQLLACRAAVGWLDVGDFRTGVWGASNGGVTWGGEGYEPDRVGYVMVAGVIRIV